MYPPTHALSLPTPQVLRIMERTFGCYILEDPAAAALKEKINSLEAGLSQVGRRGVCERVRVVGGDGRGNMPEPTN